MTLRQLILNTLLINSAKKGILSEINVWLHLGAQINYANSYGWTALIKAAHGGHTYIVKKLLEVGADINAIGADGLGGSLYYAVVRNKLSTIKLLLKKGADVNISDPIHNLTALQYAAIYSIHDAVLLLLAHPNIHDSVPTAEARIGAGAYFYQYSPDYDAIERTNIVQQAFAHWHLSQAVWESIQSHDLLLLDTSIITAYNQGVSPETLSRIRDKNGLTLLGYMVKCVNLKAINILLKRMINPLISSNIDSISIGTYAMRCGNLLLSQQLYNKTLKAACRYNVSLNQLRSEIVVGNGVNLPRELVNYILEFIIKIELPPGF
jgi:ankyrin repeat protein